MEFLKDILGTDLYNQVENLINAYNGKDENKDKTIKIANLSSGDYIGKGKYETLQALFDSQKAELQNANSLIEELKKGTKSNDGLQSKITEYENTVQQLQTQLQETKIKSALKLALTSEKAVDIDYLTYKLESQLKNENKALELDETDSIKGWNDMLSELKTKYPTQFDNGSTVRVIGAKLPQGEPAGNGEPKTLAEALEFADNNKQ